MECIPFKYADFKRKENKFIIIIIVLVFIITNIIYSSNYKDRYSFWNNAVKTSPVGRSAPD